MKQRLKESRKVKWELQYRELLRSSEEEYRGNRFFVEEIHRYEKKKGESGETLNYHDAQTGGFLGGGGGGGGRGGRKE